MEFTMSRFFETIIFLPKFVKNGQKSSKMAKNYPKIWIYRVSILWGDRSSYPDVGNRNLAHHNRRRGNYAADYFRWRPRGYPQLGVGCPCNHVHNRFFHFLTKCNLTCKVTKEINVVNKIISYTNYGINHVVKSHTAGCPEIHRKIEKNHQTWS